MTAAATCHVCGKVYDGHHNRYVNEHNLSQHMKSKQAHTKIPVLSPQSKSNQVSRPPPGLVYLPGQAGTPVPQSWHQVGQVGTPVPQPWHQVGLVSTPVSRSWDQMGQVNTPFQLGYQVGISPLPPPDQMSQGSRPLLLGYQVASTLQSRDPMGQVIGTPPIPWGQDCQVRRPLSRPLEKVAQVVTPPRRLGDQLGRIGTPPQRLGDEVGRIGTHPPRLGDQLGYICVTNDDNSFVGQGFVHLPLNPDYTLSTSTLKEVFPEATGLYYYSSDNMLMGVLQHNDKLFPPSSGDEVLYITRKMLDSSGGNHFRMKDECPVSGLSAPKECCSVGNHLRMKEEFPFSGLLAPKECCSVGNHLRMFSVSGLSAPKECCTCSELKTQVDEMTVAMKELRTEISELKYSQISTQNGSELDENANMFIPALTLSDREALKNYQIKRPGNVDKNNEEMEKCMVAKSAKNIENEGHQLFDDLVHNPDIHKIDKCVDMKMFVLNIEEIDLQKMEKCDEVKTDKLSNDNTGIQTMNKCVQLEKVELVDEKESIEEIEKCLKMKNAELIDLVSDKSPSLANEKSRKPIINTRTASWVLNLPNVPVKTETEIPSKISQTSKAKLIHGNSIEKSVNGNNIDSNEKPTSFQLEENLEGRNLLSYNQLISMNTNNQLKTDESSSCGKSKKLVTLRPKLCSKKSGKKSSNQLVKSKVLEKGGIYDSDQSVKNHQLESNEKSDSTQSSDQTPMHAKLGIINDPSRIKKNDSSTVSSNHPNIVTFHVQRGSSFELTEKLVYDFFCSNYGKVNSVEYRSSSGKGIVHFASNITKDVFYKEIEIDDCSVYTSRRLQDLTEESVKTQILLESRHLTLGWDRSIILRKHFEKFGKVLGVVFIGNKGEIKRAIVGFDEEKVAERLVGVTEVINGARVMIQRVNSKTI